MGANFGTNTVFERSDNTPTIGVVLGVSTGNDIYIQRQANLVAANLHVTLFHDIQQTHLNALGQVWQFVNTENTTVGTWNHSIVNSELIREIAALGHTHRVYLAHQVRDGDIRRCQFLTIAPVTWQPGYLYIIAQFIHLIATSSTNRLIGAIIYLTSGNDRHVFI